MGNKKVLAVLCLVGAILLGSASSLVTAKFFASFDDSWFKWVMVAIGLTIDFGKFAFPAVASFQLSKEKYLSSIAFWALAIACVIVSFAASMSYDFNVANEISNEAVTTSGAYQRQDTVFRTTAESVSAIKNDISYLKTTRKDNENKIRADYAPLIATAKKLNMLTINKDSVAEITKRMNADIKALDTAIATKEAELSQKESKLTETSSAFSTIGTGVKTTKGIYALAAWFSPSNPDDALGKINAIKNVLIEVTAIAFSISFGILINSDSIRSMISNKLPSKQETKKPIFTGKFKKKPSGSVVTAKQSIGFKPSPSPCKIDGIKDSDIIQYEKVMRETAKDNVAKGYKIIADQVGISLESARKIRGYLQLKGTIKTDGSKTIIL